MKADISSGGRPTGGRLLAMAVLLLACFGAYANSLGNGFVWDDNDIIVGSSWDAGYSRFGAGMNRDIRNIPAFFTSADTAFAESTPYYRPLNRITYLLDYLVWGLRPAGYHLTSLVLHAAAVLLLFSLIRKRFGSQWAAFAGALLFAVHPANAETVNFISTRNNILCTVFYLSAIISFLWYQEGRSAAALAWGGLFAGAALLSKEIAVTLPLMVLVMLPANDRSGRRIAFTVSAATVFIYLMLRVAVLGSAGPSILPGLWQRMTAVPILFFEYVRLSVFPFHLDASYLIEGFGPHDPRFAGGAAALAGLAYAFRRVRDGAFRAGLAWWALNLVLVINIVPVPSAPMAERYLYLPLAGLSVAVSPFLAGIGLKRPRAAAAAVVILALALAARTVVRNADWRSDDALYRSMVASNPRNPFGHYNLGVTYLEQGRSDMAVAEFEELVRLAPDSAKAHLSLANSHWKAGAREKALREWERAVEVEPGNIEALHQLASYHRIFGDRKRAIEILSRILLLAPADPVAQGALRELRSGPAAGAAQ